MPRALAANSVTALDEHLAGPTGLVLAGRDPVAAAKVLTDFVKEFEKPTIKIGLVDGHAVTSDQVKRLASLPPKQVLLSQLAGAMQASLSQAVYLFAAPLSQTARVVEALRAKVEAAGGGGQDIAATLEVGKRLDTGRGLGQA